VQGEEYVNSKTLTDVTFNVEGRPFYAHRIALLASSEAFRAMFGQVSRLCWSAVSMSESQIACHTEVVWMLAHAYELGGWLLRCSKACSADPWLQQQAREVSRCVIAHVRLHLHGLLPA
jgi:hypothetical protein